jgi:DNA invertase Pin-like site-specific DNA recombinase
MAKAYSYIRMSTGAQLQGDSLRRQMRRSEEYAREHNLTIDETFSLQDIGLSAFSGANVEKGDLGVFLQAVKDGRIKKGSYLLVESLDRLSRQKVETPLGMFLEILKHGIYIATLIDGHLYTPGKIDYPQLTFSLAIMARSFDESVTKSDRVASAWQNKRERKGILTKLCVAWVKIDNDRTSFSLIPERSAVVRRIFHEAADLGMGCDLIARRLNKDEIPTFGKSRGWHMSYIYKILSNKAVIGEFQPHVKREGKRAPVGNPIPNYYPPVIDENLFYRAQASRQNRLIKRSGRKGLGYANLFSGLLRCGTCDGPMHFLNKGGEHGQFVVCGNARRGLTDCFGGGWRYDEFEKTFLTFIREAKLAQVIGQLKPDNEQVKLQAEIGEMEGRLLEAKSRREKAFEMVAENPPSTYLKGKVYELDNTVTELEKALEEKKQLQISIRQSEESFEEGKQEIAELVEKLQSSDREAFDLRSAISAHLHSIVDRIQIWPGGTPSEITTEKNVRFLQVRFKDGSYRYIRPGKDFVMVASGEPMQFGDQPLSEKLEAIRSVVAEQTMIGVDKQSRKVVKDLLDKAPASPVLRALKDHTDK